MYRVFSSLFFFSVMSLNAQELFVFTEPASNMATNSVGFRMMNLVMKKRFSDEKEIHYMPEVMLGLHRNLMVHGQLFVNNLEGKYVNEGYSFYAKYRFFSDDEVQKHFRLAVYGRYSKNDTEVHQEEIETMAHNSGTEFGLIATQLIHKVALSSSLSYERSTNNVSSFNFVYPSKAINLTFSAGKLMLPKNYTDYKQTNINIMLEFLGQKLLENGHYFVDIAPSVQFIFFSKIRLDIGYRTELTGNLYRNAPSGLLFRVEYNIFNVL